jgi:hypothetical protein
MCLCWTVGGPGCRFEFAMCLCASVKLRSDCDTGEKGVYIYMYRFLRKTHCIIYVIHFKDLFCIN